MMMFHEVAGGRIYTHLTNRREAPLELSNHITSGRAVLLGRAAAPLSECRCSVNGSADAIEVNDNEVLGFCRVVFPVAEYESKSRN